MSQVHKASSLHDSDELERKLEALRAEQERRPTFERHMQIHDLTRALYARRSKERLLMEMAAVKHPVTKGTR